MTIKIEKLCKTIRKKDILSNVSYEFCSGKVYGLIGPNGSGKTMLLKTICGLEFPTTGTISIDGEVLGKNIDFPRSIGLLIENPAFIDRYSGLKNLQIIASIKSLIDDNEIKHAMKSVGLDPDEKKKYRNYSLGMKQKLGIACALMENPKIILLDEPTNALDSESVESIQYLITNAKEQGSTIIVASHDPDTVRAVSDAIVEIVDGAIIERSS